MGNNKNYSIREHVIDRCLHDIRKRYSTHDLMSECNKELDCLGYSLVTSLNTIRADIAAIEYKWNVTILQQKEGRHIYYRYEDPNFSIYKSPLTEIEIQHLNQTLEALSRFQGLPQFQWIDEIKARFKTSFINTQNVESIISFDENSQYKGKDYITYFLDAINHKEVIRINYHPFNKDVTSNVLHPYFLKQYNNRWYILGLDNDRKELSIYALDRIVSLEQVAMKYVENSQIDFKELFDQVIGVSLFKNSEPHRVVLFINKELYPYIESKPIHISQRLINTDDNGFYISFDVLINYELEQLILSFGEKVRVLEPKELQEKILTRIKRNLENYE